MCSLQDAARSASSDSVRGPSVAWDPRQSQTLGDSYFFSVWRGVEGAAPYSGSWEVSCESMQFRLSPYLHAELVLHKESVYHAQSRGSDGGAPSGSDPRHYSKSEPAINLKGFFFFLPLFLKTKKKRDRINFFSLTNFFL